MQEIARKDFEQSIERKIDLLLPYDAKAASQAARLGKALSDAARSTKLGQALTQLGKLALAEAMPPPDAEAKSAKGKIAEKKPRKQADSGEAGDKGGPASIMGRFSGIKKLLPSRSKTAAAAPGAPSGAA